MNRVLSQRLKGGSASPTRVGVVRRQVIHLWELVHVKVCVWNREVYVEMFKIVTEV